VRIREALHLLIQRVYKIDTMDGTTFSVGVLEGMD